MGTRKTWLTRLPRMASAKNREPVMVGIERTLLLIAVSWANHGLAGASRGALRDERLRLLEPRSNQPAGAPSSRALGGEAWSTARNSRAPRVETSLKPVLMVEARLARVRSAVKNRPGIVQGPIEEDAAFWETHSFADSWDEFKPVGVRFAKNLSAGLATRLDPETLKELRSQARAEPRAPSKYRGTALRRPVEVLGGPVFRRVTALRCG